jgi:hypothetical protein
MPAQAHASAGQKTSLAVFYDGYPPDDPLAVAADAEHAKLAHIVDWRVTRHLVLADHQVVLATAQYAGIRHAQVAKLGSRITVLPVT